MRMRGTEGKKSRRKEEIGKVSGIKTKEKPI
jgi:hypothetical protein